MKRTRTTQAQKEQIISMLLAGMIGCDIAYAVGVSMSTVSKIRQQLEREGRGCWHNGGSMSAWVSYRAV